MGPLLPAPVQPAAHLLTVATSLGVSIHSPPRPCFINSFTQFNSLITVPSLLIHSPLFHSLLTRPPPGLFIHPFPLNSSSHSSVVHSFTFTHSSTLTYFVSRIPIQYFFSYNIFPLVYRETLLPRHNVPGSISLQWHHPNAAENRKTNPYRIHTYSLHLSTSDGTAEGYIVKDEAPIRPSRTPTVVQQR